jgi:hypothetical protein
MADSHGKDERPPDESLFCSQSSTGTVELSDEQNDEERKSAVSIGTRVFAPGKLIRLVKFWFV